MMHLASLAAMVVANPVSPTATITRPIFAPSAIEYSVSAECPGREATLHYSLIPRETDQIPFELNRLAISRSGESAVVELESEELPREVRAIERPFIERAIPMCADKDKFLFALYIAADEDVVLPTYVNQGRVMKLYVSVSPENDVSVFAREPEWSRLRAMKER